MRPDPAAYLGRPVHDLPTPCLTLDRRRLAANLQTLQGDVTRAGKALRAHAKSHKCTRLAQQQIAAGAVGICAAKLSEAEGLAAAGVPGILVTGPIVSPEAHDRLARCFAAGGDLTITLEDEGNALAISAALARQPGCDGRSLPFLLDLDIGQGRTGVSPEQAEATVARFAAIPHLRMIGIQAYAGHLQHIICREERLATNQRCLEIAQRVFAKVKGGAVQILSVGGTGSYEFDLDAEPVTEVQAGSYALMDADYYAVQPSVGSEWRFQRALTLRTRVMSTLRPGYVTVDAGLKTIYHDGPAPLVVQPAGGSLVYDWFGDEYGRITGTPEALASLEVGSMLSLIVSHCDPTVNLFDTFYVVEDEQVVDIWPIDLRGCCY